MAHPITHIEIMTRSLDKVQKFYKDLFDWDIKVNPNMGGYGMVDTGAKGVGFCIGTPMPGGMPMLTFYVDVDNCQTYMDKAVKLGGKVVVPPTVIPGMLTFALFADPEGNIVGVAKNEGAM